MIKFTMSFELEIIKMCTGCGVYKSLDKFCKYRERLSPACLDCKNQISWKYRNTFDGFMKILLSRARENSRSRLSKGRIEAGIFNLTFEYLASLWKWQNGKCYYSGIQMNPRPCSDWQCSLERLNNDLGYVPSNVVFVCLEFNGFAKWSSYKIKQIPFLIDNQNDPSILAEIEDALVKRKVTSNKKRVSINDLGQYICNGCNTYKNVTEFYSTISNGCRDCHKLRRIRHINTVRGHLQRLLVNAKTHTVHRNNVQSRTADNTFDITFEDLIAILRIQRGRCAYSNIKLNYGPASEKDWIASLERIDSTKGYVRDNVCIVCSEFNGPDQITHTKYSNDGSAGWSKEKFYFFLSAIVSRWFQQSGLTSPYIGINNLTCVNISSNNTQLEIIG